MSLNECDCLDVCGWTKAHTLEREGQWWLCFNCGTELLSPTEKEFLISFDCSLHGKVDWAR